jgi:hypothetical protein
MLNIRFFETFLYEKGFYNMENDIKNREHESQYDLTKVYNYKEFPDKISGRCDNCGNTSFKSSVKDFIFIRECRNCGMKKSI